MSDTINKEYYSAWWRDVGVAGKSLLVLIACGFVFNCLPGAASATLLNVSGVPLAHDSLTDLYWYTDLTQFRGGNYQQQQSAIAAIQIEGFTGFHLATIADTQSLLASLLTTSDTSVFTPTDMQYDNIFWTGRTDEIVISDPEYGTYRRVYYFYAPTFGTAELMHQAFSVEDGSMSLSMPDLTVSAWVVGSKEQLPIPEPGTLFLLTVGISGLGIARLVKGLTRGL